jgi:hypothetical protein
VEVMNTMQLAHRIGDLLAECDDVTSVSSVGHEGVGHVTVSFNQMQERERFQIEVRVKPDE